MHTIPPCWSGPPSDPELKILAALPSYGLESLRQRALFSFCDNHAATHSARVILQMAYETELRTVIDRLLLPPGGLAEASVCARRRFIDIDTDLQYHRYLIEPALKELEACSVLPIEYVNLLRAYLGASYPRYRVCAVACMICLACFSVN
jgi:hypothetical protein